MNSQRKGHLLRIPTRKSGKILKINLLLKNCFLEPRLRAGFTRYKKDLMKKGHWRSGAVGTRLALSLCQVEVVQVPMRFGGLCSSEVPGKSGFAWLVRTLEIGPCFPSALCQLAWRDDSTHRGPLPKVNCPQVALGARMLLHFHPQVFGMMSLK